VRVTHYDDPIVLNPRQIANSILGSYAGFLVADSCNATMSAALPVNVSDAPLPCSLKMTNGFTNVAYPNETYQTLGTGISQLSSDFNGLNFSSLIQAENGGKGTPFQVVTYVNADGLDHSLLFYVGAAAEEDLTGNNDAFGIDYVAETTSMVTQCFFQTKECNVHSINASSNNNYNNNNISIPFHCYDDFSGDLGQTPSTGHERAQGWNMSFYEPINGTSRNVPVQAQSNPFHFSVATAVNSINLPDLRAQSTLPEGILGNNSLVDGGRDFTAFALRCDATIYDITFSLVNGSFYSFNATKSSPQKASIIKAPLQVGFGQYHLYQAASLAALATNDSIAHTMAKAFSQTGMALASGAFSLESTTKQRFRWTVNATKVPKAPFFYLVVVCLVYSVFGMAMTILALHLRTKPEVRDRQARLMVEWGPEVFMHKEKSKGEEKGDDDDAEEGKRERRSFEESIEG